MPDGKMGMHHPGFPRTPKTDNLTGWEKKGKSCLTTEHSHRNYSYDARGGSPFGVGGDSPGGSHGNHDSPGRDRSGPVRKPGGGY